jgi:hypothetical protein
VGRPTRAPTLGKTALFAEHSNWRGGRSLFGRESAPYSRTQCQNPVSYRCLFPCTPKDPVTPLGKTGFGEGTYDTDSVMAGDILWV